MEKYWEEKQNGDKITAEIFNNAFNLIAKDIKEIQETSGKSPYIGNNGNWYEWDSNLGEYVDTGIVAEGYTPVKGTDYWTDADKAEIKSYVDEAILGGAW